MSGDRDIGDVLGELGFTESVTRETARKALQAAGLTRPGKSRISEGKLLKVKALLDDAFARVCSDPKCRAAVQRQKPRAALLSVTDARSCEHCGGSENRKAMLRLAHLCQARGIRRVVIVGGSPSVRAELLALKPSGWDLRLIDGTERRTHDRARADLEWADLVFVWGSSELDHRVSKLYTDTASSHRHKILHVARRGVAALLNAGSEHLERLT